MPSTTQAPATDTAPVADRVRPLLHATELLLALGVLLVGAVAFDYLPQPYPEWPAIGSVPVAPALVVPALLGLAALAGAVVDRAEIGSILLGLLGGTILAFGGVSLSLIYAAGTGGVFFTGLFTLVGGIVLAIAVVGYRLHHADTIRSAVRGVRGRIDG